QSVFQAGRSPSSPPLAARVGPSRGGRRMPAVRHASSPMELGLPARRGKACRGRSGARRGKRVSQHAAAAGPGRGGRRELPIARSRSRFQTGMPNSKSNDLPDDLLRFIQVSPTPFHAVAESIRRLEAAGYPRLDETAHWELAPGAQVDVVRADSSIAAFRLGRVAPAEGGFRLVGAHTDSPNLRLKPRATFARAGVRQLGVEVYGGVLLHTWLDRDLSMAGRVIARSPDGAL